jgi:hypothetical protein
MIYVLGIKGNEHYAKKIISTWCYSQKAVVYIKASKNTIQRIRPNADTRYTGPILTYR